MTEIASNDLRALFRDVLRIRMVEEAIAERYAEQEMRCPVHLSIGQEAAAVGVCAALDKDDLVVSGHRSHAHYLAKGGDLKKMIAELYGRATGCTGGRGGSMHLVDPACGFQCALPIVGGSIPIGVGLALALKQAQRPQVVGIFVGDATIEEGVFHESANFAAVHRLPVVFVCENNLYSVYTHLSDRQPDRPLADLARGHGMPVWRGDGNDLGQVLAQSREAVAHARAGQGPVFLEFTTYRWREHCGPNYDNHIGYRTEEEFQSWVPKDPMAQLAAKLRAAGQLTAADEERLRGELAAEIAAAFAFAKASPYPDAATAGDKIYA
ncbi:MAG: thiamine pyrophosphate-dependent dehydrogenase E1 component subunit alpha [Rhodospirillaceae bacterium]|nr:thiamine pyrophosphate-dependent dehydrogenase E1 component subunit alpha [Rhodospirillaceae bacterium]